MAEVTCDQRRVVQRLLLDAMYPAVTRVTPGKYEARIFGRVFEHYVSEKDFRVNAFIVAHEAIRRKIELEFLCSST